MDTCSPSKHPITHARKRPHAHTNAATKRERGGHGVVAYSKCVVCVDDNFFYFFPWVRVLCVFYPLKPMGILCYLDNNSGVTQVLISAPNYSPLPVCTPCGHLQRAGATMSLVLGPGKTREKGPQAVWKFHYMQEIWQDPEIRFDVPRAAQDRAREFEVDSNKLSRGHQGKQRQARVSRCDQPRLIWAQHSNPTTNLSIGFNCITSINIRQCAPSSEEMCRVSMFDKRPKPKTNGSKEVKFTSLSLYSHRW